MDRFKRSTYKSFENSGAGDCLFESFKQFLQLPDTVMNMRSDMVNQLEHASEEIRVSQLNEHIMREIDARNEKYMGWGINGGEGLDARNARITFISSRFSELWALYVRDMQYSAAYAGSAEIVALTNMYGVNVTIWAHCEQSSTASHLMTHLQSPPACRTVHLLNLGNIHYEATNLPDCEYPIVAALRPSARPVRGASQAAQHLPSSASPLPGNHLEMYSSTITDSTASATDPALPQSKTSDCHSDPISRPPIQEYCGLVLDSETYFHSIINNVKIYEVRTIRRTQLCPRILFHPGKKVRDSGYTQNIEAKISPYQHDKMINSAQALLNATNNGKDLGLTEEETRKFVADAKAKQRNAVFYLYLLSEPKKSEIEWIDSAVYNQFVFSTHQYTHKKTNAVVTLFRWPQV